MKLLFNLMRINNLVSLWIWVWRLISSRENDFYNLINKVKIKILLHHPFSRGPEGRISIPCRGEPKNERYKCYPTEPGHKVTIPTLLALP